MADGCFTARRLHLGVAKKDLKHLKKFMNFVNSKNTITKTVGCTKTIHYRLTITCVKVITELRKKFNISNRKTYEPCDIKSIKNPELLFSLIVGFLDGDGCVSKRPTNCYSISFVGHMNWLDNFCFMKAFVYNYFNHEDTTMKLKIIKKYTTLPQDKTKTKKLYYGTGFNINKIALIKAIKTKAKELNLPFLKRKLGKVH